MDLVTVAHYFSYVDAETDRLALEAKGLKVWILSENDPLPGVPGVQLQVRSEDFAAAMATLESEPVPSSDLPADIAEPPCPKCGSRSVTEAADIPEVSGALSSLPPERAWFYHSASCGHK